jgi:hypothetical protein
LILGFDHNRIDSVGNSIMEALQQLKVVTYKSLWEFDHTHSIYSYTDKLRELEGIGQVKKLVFYAGRSERYAWFLPWYEDDVHQKIEQLRNDLTSHLERSPCVGRQIRQYLEEKHVAHQQLAYLVLRQMVSDGIASQLSFGNGKWSTVYYLTDRRLALEDILKRIFEYVKTNGFAFYHDVSKFVNVDSALCWTLLEYLANQKKIVKFKVGWSYTKNKPVFAYCMDGYETKAVLAYHQLLSKLRKDRMVENYSTIFKQACQKLKIDKSVADLSCTYLRQSSKVVKGRNYSDVAWSAYFLANKTLRQGLAPGDIESVAGSTRERILAISKIMNTQLDLKISDLFPKPGDYLKRILNNLELSESVKSRMFEETSTFIDSLPRRLLFGKRPESFAAAALYIVARSSSDYEIRYVFRQNRIAEASDVTEVTLRNMLRKIENCLDSDSIFLRESYMSLLHRDMPPKEEETLSPVIRSEPDFNMKECEICGYTEGDGETLTWFVNRKCWLCEDCATHDKLTKSLEGK